MSGRSLAKNSFKIVLRTAERMTVLETGRAMVFRDLGIRISNKQNAVTEAVSPRWVIPLTTVVKTGDIGTVAAR